MKYNIYKIVCDTAKNIASIKAEEVYISVVIIMYKKARQKQMPQPANMGFSTQVGVLMLDVWSSFVFIKLTASTAKITIISNSMCCFGSGISDSEVNFNVTTTQQCHRFRSKTKQSHGISKPEKKQLDLPVKANNFQCGFLPFPLQIVVKRQKGYLH